MSSSRFIRFASASKLRKSLICRFRRISISPRKFPEKPKHECAEEFRNTTLKRRRRNSKSRTSAAISVLAGCGCHSRLGIIPDPMIPADSQMPELCSVQSLPSCSSPESKVEQCPEWRLSRSFDEMLKGSSTSHGGEVHYNHKSSMDNSLVELQISAVKFNDLVTKINGGKMVNQKTVGLVSRGLASPKVSSPRRSVRKTVNDSPATSTNKMIQSNVKRGQMTDSLLIMKLPSDPRREFRDSMMEMIAENKIRAWKDLEELLACYLLLNSAAYHDVIIQVFKQIWVDLIHAQQNNKRNKY